MWAIRTWALLHLPGRIETDWLLLELLLLLFLFIGGIMDELECGVKGGNGLLLLLLLLNGANGGRREC